MPLIEAARFGIEPNSEKDAIPALRAALTACRDTNASALAFEGGTYHFWPDRAFEKYAFISNNDEGLKRVAFLLRGKHHFRIDGRGAQFIFHGPMTPFLVEECRDLRIENLSIDYTRPFHSEGRILAVREDSVDLAIPEDYPFDIRNGVLVFVADIRHPSVPTTVKSGEILYPYGHLLAYDPERRETAYMVYDKYGVQSGIAAESIGPRQVRIQVPGVNASPGDTLVFAAAHRNDPGFVISKSSDIRLRNVRIHHVGGMGVIAQRSANISLDHLIVAPPNESRVISATADATHFTNCTGRIEIRDCIFENQMDDASNIHGLYGQVTRILGPNKLEVRLVHPQQAGLTFIEAGTRLEFSDHRTLEGFGECVVESVEYLNKEYSIVTTTEMLPASVLPRTVVADADANTAEVIIENCVIRNNRARGILLGSRGKMRITGNTFHTPGAALLFEGDANHWFEQAGVRDVVIRNNTFDNCNYGVWGDACIEVRSGIAEASRVASRYNRNITIEENVFRVFGTHPLVAIYSVSGLTFRKNSVELTHLYPPRKNDGHGWLDSSNCDRIQWEDPVEICGKRSLPDAHKVLVPVAEA
ncbi:parallel beta-helix repeat-containing protein [Terrimicrobium sacchariphilum]|uniref:Parallel beta-helix repeat-containing protein n=1 Tax=Terrimicrobium sacchariphilum TaxID=690879 RepID=A0A146G8W0_TERSA|nr:right-handed parallel beta-helix repeat-containing protein [Terrimicrobium sacchariphilum]GAT33056.1 parallel beta-helix repeat-containing protein [Terrimicrobium sacchariphilum]